MTSTNGTYTDCGNDHFALFFTCTGPSCSGLQGFPLNVTCTNLSSTSIQCSNGITCQNPSNFTSIFSFYQNNLTTSQSQNITTGGKSYMLIDQGTPNSTTVTQTSSGSTLFTSPRIRANLLLLIILFCIMVAQVSAISFQNIVEEFTSGSLGTYLNNHLDGEPYSADTFLQDIVGAMCEGGVVGGALNLLGGPTKQCVAVLEGLTAITVPEAEFAFAFLGSMLCDEIINGLLDGVPGQVEDGLCSALESAVGLAPSKSTSITTLSISTSKSTLSTSASISSSSSPSPPTITTPPSGPGPSLPDSATLSQDTCVSCLLSAYYIGITGLAKTCNAVATGTAFDLSTFFCDPSIKPRYSQLCSSLCANPCGTYNVQTLIMDAGSAYNPSASLALCNADCPGFAGTGRCSALAPQCECGVGSATCQTACS